MKKFSHKELETAQRIFDHVNDISGGYYGTDRRAKNFISRNRWMMFPVFNVTSLKEGTSFSAPNIFVSFKGDKIEANKKGQVNGVIGVTYNTKEAMLWLKQSLSRKSRPFIKNIVKLETDWTMFVKQKIKTNFNESAPVYKTIKQIDADKVNIKNLKSAISISDSNLLTSEEAYMGEPVLWSTTVFSVETFSTQEYFDTDIEKAFKFFKNALALK